MYPKLLEFPHISSYSALLLMAYLLGYLLTRMRARHAGLETRHVDNLGLILLVSGLVGARLFARLFYLPNVTGLDVLKLWEGGGLVFYGGLIAGGISVVAYTLWLRLPLLKMLDAFAPGVALGLSFGRVGCFLAGCCWGDVCLDHSVVQARLSDPQRLFQVQTFPSVSSPSYIFAVQFPERAEPTKSHKRLGLINAEANRSAPVHPVQLYEAVLAALLALFAHRASRENLGSGRAAILLLGGYAVIRFSTEFFRADNRAMYAGMTISQVVSLCMLAVAIGLLFARRERVSLVQPAALAPQ